MTKKNSTLGFLLKNKSVIIIFVLIIVVVGATLLNSNYLSGDNIKTILFSCALSGTISVGVGCLLISGNNDLSCAAVGCFAGLLMSVIMRDTSLGWAPSLIICIIFGAAAGAFNAFLSTVCHMMPFIATLAMMSVWQGLGYIISNNLTIMLTDEVYWEVCTGTLFGVIPYAFLYTCVLMLIYGFILHSTRFGRSIYMVGGNRQAARLAGISSEKITSILMINCSALAAFGGCILAGRMHGGNPASVHGTQLTSITAVVMGGVAFGGGSGGMLGAFFGVLLLNAFNNALTVVGLGTYWQMLASGVLLVVALMIDYASTQYTEKTLKAGA